MFERAGQISLSGSHIPKHSINFSYLIMLKAECFPAALKSAVEIRVGLCDIAFCSENFS